MVYRCHTSHCAPPGAGQLTLLKDALYRVNFPWRYGETPETPRGWLYGRNDVGESGLIDSKNLRYHTLEMVGGGECAGPSYSEPPPTSKSLIIPLQLDFL